MRFPLLLRFPRESKVAAVVLGAALLQVSVLAALGLRSTAERRRGLESELQERGRSAAETVTAEAARRVRDQEQKLQRALDREDLPSPLQRVRVAIDQGVAPAFESAYLIDPEGGIRDWRRAAYDPPPAGATDATARRRLEEILALEHSDPPRAIELARALVEDLQARGPHDVVAAALALQAGWRAAFASGDAEQARAFAKAALGSPSLHSTSLHSTTFHYRTVRDAAGPLSESEPIGPGAAKVLCEVLLRALATSPRTGGEFVQAVLDRRVQAQRLGPLLSRAAYEVETVECRRLLRDATALDVPYKRELEIGLEECDKLDQALERVARVPSTRLREAAAGDEPVRIAVDTLWLMTVIPLDRSGGREGQGDIAAIAFVASPSALRAEAIEPALRTVDLPEGVRLVVRDSMGRDLLDPAEGPLLGGLVPFRTAVPGVQAGAVLTQPELVEEATTSDRRYWLWVLAAAALAVVAASLLAVRAVLREVRLARMKSDFVSNLSHELRTPLTSLRMFVETLQEGRVRDEAEAKECLDVVAQETNRLSSLVDRILQFASFTRGRAPIELRVSDAGEVVRRAVEVFRKRAEAAAAQIEVQIAPDLPPVALDRDAVIQVILNLLDNAVKYAGHSGARVRVTAAPDAPGGSRLAIVIEDDGPGVPERERELVFEEFYRGDDTLARRVQGTGIGLALARRIVLAHGGRIHVARSRALGGAAFRITLPRAETVRRLAPAAAGGTS